MSKYLVVAAAVALAACGPKDEAPAADTTAVTTTTTVTTTVTDTTIRTDTIKVAGDTSKAP
jgi:hypothetical protein